MNFVKFVDFLNNNGIKIINPENIKNININNLCLSSADVVPGTLFIALPGLNRDGRYYIQDALERGAECILLEEHGLENFPEIPSLQKKYSDVIWLSLLSLREQLSGLAGYFYHSPSEELLMIGITGTNGKTTCTQLLAQSLELLGIRAATIGTLGYGFTGDLKASGLNTPDPITLQKILSSVLEQGAKVVAMEVSSHGLAQSRVKQVKYTSAIFTNLSQDHLDYHQTMEAYGLEKIKLFTMPGLKRAVLNWDDSFSREIIKYTSPDVKIISYSQKNQKISSEILFVNAVSPEFTQQGIKSRIETSWGHGILESRLAGEFNLSNLLAVLAELCLQGVPLEKALIILSRVQPVIGRMQRLGGGGRFPDIIIDYAHTPDALEKALAVAKNYCQKSLWVVFGAGGDRDKSKRPMMGEVASRLADKVIITSDNPRTEDLNNIIHNILMGVCSDNQSKIHLEPDRKKAIEYAVQHAKIGDMILVAGKGHETYQIIGDQKYFFSDEQCIHNYLESLEVKAHAEKMG